MKKNKIKIYNQIIIIDKKDMLPDDFVKRVIKYKEILKEVEKTELSEIIKDFNNDMYPEIELSLWENLAEKYKGLIKDKPYLTLSEKEELFNQLLSVFFD